MVQKKLLLKLFPVLYAHISLFSGKEIFVGMTKNTNALGAQSVAKAFPEYTVSVIRIDGDRNLKYYVSMAGTNIMAVGMSMEAKKVMAVSVPGFPVFVSPWKKPN